MSSPGDLRNKIINSYPNYFVFIKKPSPGREGRELDQNLT